MNKCSQCDIQLDENIHIYIMTKRSKYNLRNNRGTSEEVVCYKCRYDVDWSEGWEDDESD